MSGANWLSSSKSISGSSWLQSSCVHRMSGTSVQDYASSGMYAARQSFNDVRLEPGTRPST